MSKTIRNLLFGFFVLMFVITSVVLVIYALGYNFDWRHWSLQKTGILVLDSQPKGHIVIDGVEQLTWLTKLTSNINYQAMTPDKIKNLPPGDHRAAVTLSGYFPWQKTLPIAANQSTYAKNIHLFKDEPPQFFSPAQQPLVVAYAPDHNSVAWSDGQTVNQLNFTDGQTKVVANLQTSLPMTLNWSSNGTKLSVGQQIYQTADNAKLTVLPTASLQHWDADDDNLLCYQTQQQIYALTFKNGASTNKLLYQAAPNTVIADFVCADNYLYVINDSATSQMLIWRLSDASKIGTVALSGAAPHKILDKKKNWLALADGSGKLWVLEIILPWLAKYQLTAAAPLATAALWLDNDQLLFANDFELWLWHRADNSQELITRISQPITDLFNFNNDYYLLYGRRQSITAIELDSRDQRNTYSLVSGELLFPALNAANNKLYFWQTKNNHSGWYVKNL